MSWLIGGFIILAVIGAGLLWYSGVHYGRVKERNEILEKGIEHERKVRKTVAEIYSKPHDSLNDAVNRMRMPKDGK